MIRIRNDVKFIIILLVIFISIYFGNKRSGLIDSFTPKGEVFDTKTADKVFEKSENKRKILMQFKVDNLSLISSAISDIIFQEGVTTKYSDSKDNFQLHILEIPKADAEEIVKNLRQIKILAKENIQTSPFSAFEANVEENIKNNTITKNRIQAMINRTTSPQSMANFRRQLDTVQTKIDSLNNLKTIQTHNAEYDLIYIHATKNLQGKDNLAPSVKGFLINTVVMLLVLTVLLVIVYFFIVGLTKLMEVLGIKTKRGGSRSNYNYGYTYGRGKKKVKRKYISEEEAEKKKTEEEEEDK